MSSINLKLGLKPRTRARTATHGKTIVSDATCPSCRAYRVRETTLNRIVNRSCEACGHRWRPNGEPPHTYYDGIGQLRCEGCLLIHPKHLPTCKHATTETV